MEMFCPIIHAGHVVGLVTVTDWRGAEQGIKCKPSWWANIQKALKWNEEWKDFGITTHIALTRQKLITEAWWQLIDQHWSAAKDTLNTPQHTVPINVYMWLLSHSCIAKQIIASVWWWHVILWLRVGFLCILLSSVDDIYLMQISTKVCIYWCISFAHGSWKSQLGS